MPTPPVTDSRREKFNETHHQITTVLDTLRTLVAECPKDHDFVERVQEFVTCSARLVNDNTYSQSLQADMYFDVCEFQRDILKYAWNESGHIHDNACKAYALAEEFSDLLTTLARYRLTEMYADNPQVLAFLGHTQGECS